MSSSDKRRHPRLPVRLAASYSSASGSCAGHVTNLSERGLSIRLSEARDALDAEVTIELPLSDADQPLHMKGVVIWISQDPDRSTGIGIRFVELSEAVAQRLSGYIKRQRGEL